MPNENYPTQPQQSLPNVAEIDANKAAELRADAAALEGKWEAFAQPGFEMSAGTIAVEAAVKTQSAPEAQAENRSSALEIAGRPDSEGQVEDKGAFKVKDKRQTNPARAEADFQSVKEAEAQADREKEEALRQPLSAHEQGQAIDKLMAAVSAYEHEREGDKNISSQQLQDMKRDHEALYRLHQLVGGRTIAWGHDSLNKSAGKSISERLDSLVKQFAQLIPENFQSEGSQDHIGSMGGTVKVGENGQVHSEGYNGSLLYTFARARQIWDTFESNPKKIRQEVLAVTEGQQPDVNWIIDQPVTVSPEDTVRQAAA